MGKSSDNNGPSSEVKSAIDSAFGSIDEMKNKFNAAAAGQFGSGWAWLSLANGKLAVSGTANQDNPLVRALGCSADASAQHGVPESIPDNVAFCCILWQHRMCQRMDLDRQCLAAKPKDSECMQIMTEASQLCQPEAA